MASFPIIAHFEPEVAAEEVDRARRLAEALQLEQPTLQVPERLRDLLVEQYVEAPTLHLDDLSGIPFLNFHYDKCFLQERGRLRAGDGDFIASCFWPTTSFEPYCRDWLGLGAPIWLHPRNMGNQLGVAAACWEDRAVRRTLVRAIRAGELYFLQPHMGISAVWELAALLRTSSRRDVKVVAPPPGLTAWTNDKLSFAATVRRLFGASAALPTVMAPNFALLSQHVREISRDFAHVVVKLPDSAGGGGTVVLDGVRFRHETLSRARRKLKMLLRGFVWRPETRLLVCGWHTNVRCSPSAQIWIPPRAQGDPIIEGVFEQCLRGEQQVFAGCRLAQLPAFITETIVNRSWLMALVFQELGYVGRCSFDLLVVGDDLDNASVRFVECNGRWGGTSMPMTLMNRLLGDWTTRPFATREYVAHGLDRLTFSDVLDHFSDDLYDARRGTGWLVFYNPDGMSSHSAINALALGDTWACAERRLRQVLPVRFGMLLQRRLRCA